MLIGGWKWSCKGMMIPRTLSASRALEELLLQSIGDACQLLQRQRRQLLAGRLRPLEQTLAQMDHGDHADPFAFHSRDLQSRVVVQLGLTPRLVALTFDIGLCQHLE